MQMKLVLVILVIVAACYVNSASAVFNCDSYFVEMAKLNKLTGIDYMDRDYINRNYGEDFCIYYYFKFLKTLGYDMTDLLNDQDTESVKNK